MAGYCGFSKSNNAIDAERGGKMTATQLGRAIGCSSRAIKALLSTGEWHHTSGWYNKTPYYWQPALLAAVGNQHGLAALEEGEIDEDDVTAALELLSRLRSYGKAVSGGAWHGCTVRWLEWSGSRRRPKATAMQQIECTVRWGGKSTVDVFTADGRCILTKRLGCRGFAVNLADGTSLIHDWDSAESLAMKVRAA